jgi:diguanylate cyclase (GGDEF)-like protein
VVDELADPRPAPQKALVVAPDGPDRVLLLRVLGLAGFEPVLCGDADAVVRIAATCEDARNLGLVVLDADLPGLAADVVCGQLRAIQVMRGTPILLVTPPGAARLIASALEAGASDFIAKPLRHSLLPLRLACILQQAERAPAAISGESPSPVKDVEPTPRREDETVEPAAPVVHSGIAEAAQVNALTGLSQRRACLDKLESIRVEAENAGDHVALVYLALGGFDRITKAYGHVMADEVLRLAEQRLAQALGSFGREYADFVLARFRECEFVVALRHADARSVSLVVADACCWALRDAIPVADAEFFLTPSLGCALFPDDGADMATVLRHANTAVNHARRTGEPALVSYVPEMGEVIRSALDLESRLRRAVRAGELRLVYQPKYRLSDFRIVGLEALMRWHDPVYGEIPPSQFIPIAEESGLIDEMGRQLVGAVCRQIRSWSDRGWSLPVAINVSPRELMQRDRSRLVEAEAAAAGISTSLIEIELTESLLIEDRGRVRAVLDRFKRLGCRIALDDFGTGYSSLAYITRFPLDRLKIDKAFITNVDRSRSDAAVAGTILALGADLGVVVTAEGVDRPGQLEWLRRRGCNEIQGFLLCRPLAAADLEAQIQKDDARRALSPTASGAAG